MKVLICESRPNVGQFLKLAISLNYCVKKIHKVVGGTPAIVCMVHEGPFDIFYLNVREMDIKKNYIDIANSFLRSNPKGKIVFLYEDFEQNERIVSEIEGGFNSQNYDLLKVPLDFFADIDGLISSIKSEHVFDYIDESRKK